MSPFPSFLSHPYLRDLYTVASEHRTHHAMWLLYNASVYIDTTFVFLRLLVFSIMERKEDFTEIEVS
jgi:hypothetical protein